MEGPVILSGDFNMVEDISDRWDGKGNVINGEEKIQWEHCKTELDLTDVGFKGDFTWQNYSAPPLARKARLDRTYISQAMANAFLRAQASTCFNTCASDHYPILTRLDDQENKVRAKWFHTDPSLFKLPCVQVPGGLSLDMEVEAIGASCGSMEHSSERNSEAVDSG